MRFQQCNTAVPYLEQGRVVVALECTDVRAHGRLRQVECAARTSKTAFGRNEVESVQVVQAGGRLFSVSIAFMHQFDATIRTPLNVEARHSWVSFKNLAVLSPRLMDPPSILWCELDASPALI